nr:diguanylate cyclase [Kineosporia rhizophila]
MEQLGGGAGSTVYRVRRDGAGQDEGAEYALKLLDRPVGASGQQTPQDLAALRKEAALLTAVDHPALPRVHEVGLAGGRPYLVMDLVRGTSLADVLDRGALVPEQVATMALDVIEPLAAVHARGLVHRDLKPQNVMVLPDGQARLIDFGLTAREGDSEGEGESPAVGTLAYSAPEQAGMLKRPVDNRSDLYSLGVIMFEALAGVLPFSSLDVGELLRAHASQPPPDLTVLVPGTPPELAAIVDTLLAKDPDDRYPDGQALAADLRDFVGKQRPVRPPQTAPMFGRQAELDTLREEWTRAGSVAGGFAFVRSANGLGKTRLVNEFGDLVEEAGGTVLRARVLPGETMPFAPFREAFEAHLHQLARLPWGERWERASRLREVFDTWSPEMIKRIAPSLESVLRPTTEQADQSGQADPAGGSRAVALPTGAVSASVTELAEQRTEEQFGIAVAEALLALARLSGGLLLILDDTTSGDASFTQVIGHLATEVRGAPLMYLSTGRDDALEQVLHDDDLAAFFASARTVLDVSLQLAPLDEASIGAQIRSLVPGQHLPDAALKALTTRSNGNPFVAQEYLWAVLDAGLLWPAWGTWRLDLDGLDALALPQDAMGLVLKRVQNLAPQARDLLVTAAAIGAEIRVDVIAAVEQRSTAAVQGALAEAARQRLIELGEEGTFWFLHGRIADALLSDLDQSGLQALHRRIADVLAARPAPSPALAVAHTFAVARHYMQAGPAAPAEKVLAACMEAGKLALEESSAEDAVLFLEHALRVGPGRTAGTSALLVLLGRALKQSGQFAAARQRLEQALAAEPDPLAQGAIYTQLAEVHRCGYRSDELEEAIHQGFAATGRPLPRNVFWLLLTSVLMALVSVPRRRLRPLLGDASGEARRRALTMAGLHEAALSGASLGMRVPEYFAHNLRSLYWAAKLGHGRRFVAAQLNVGVLFAALGLNRAAERCFRRCDADLSAQTRPIRSLVRSFRLGGAWAGNRPEGAGWRRQFEEFGPWLEFATAIDAMSAFNLTACFAGRTDEAEYWLAQGRAKLSGRAEEITTFVTAAPMTAALLGRRVEAETELGRLQAWTAEIGARQLRFVHVMAALFVLLEDGETGPPVDHAIDDFEALRLPPSLIWRANRPIFYLIAAARLAQARAAGGPTTTEGAHRTNQAAKAVELLGRAANTDEMKAFWTIARADLMVLQGQARKALDTLNDLDVAGQEDLPTPAFEAARIAARALRPLNPAESRRRARTAHAIAVFEGWPRRAESVAAEFALPVEERPGSSSVGGAVTGYSNGHERQRLEALQEVSAAASRVLDPRVLARIALEETIRILAAERAFLFLVEEGTGALVPHLGRDAAGNDLAQLTGYSTSLVDMVHRTGRAQVITGTEEGAALGAQSVVLHGLRSILIAPMKLKDRLLGVVYLDSRVAKGIFSDDDLEILTALTGVLASALETARAAERAIRAQTAERAAQLAAELARSLQTAQERMAEPVEKAAVLERLVQCAGRGAGMLPADIALLLPEESASTPFGGEGADAPGPVRQALPGVASWLALPLHATDADLGVLVLATADPKVNLGEAVEVGSALVALAMTAYDRASLFEQVRELAVVDELTQLANRRRFFEVATRDLQAARRQDRPLIGMMIDIDHFKRVNDTHGHPTGDDVIREVAARLAAQVRSSDAIGRYGGEEFAVLQQSDDPDLEMAERLRAAVAGTPVPTRTGPLAVTISIGVARLRPGDQDVAALLARADAGLYRAKQAGRNRVAETTDEPDGPDGPDVTSR